MANQEKKPQQETPVKIVEKSERKREITEEVRYKEPTSFKTLDFKLPY